MAVKTGGLYKLLTQFSFLCYKAHHDRTQMCKESHTANVVVNHWKQTSSSHEKILDFGTWLNDKQTKDTAS